MNSGLHWIDGLIIAAYAGAMLALGWFYSRRQASTEEYFTGGRAMNPFLIGISLFATLLSTISYLSKPGEMAKYGPYLLMSVLAIPIAFLVVGYVIIPVLMRHRLTSAYELLEEKLGVSSRLTGAVMFITLRLMWMAVLLNFAAGALLVMFSLDDRWLLPVTAFIGAVAIVYSTIGGLRAVVVTDLVQFLLLLGGALLVVGVVTVRFEGFSWFPTRWDPDWQIQPVFSFDPYLRLTVAGVIISQTLWIICTAGGDQTAVQRYMATRDASAARRSYLVNSLASLIVSLVLALVGLALLAYFRAHPTELPAGVVAIDYADHLFPYFISHQLPPGLSGLVVSGMLAAAMSSVDSGVNSITAVVKTDFLGRLRRNAGESPGHSPTRGARLIATAVGVVVIAASSLIRFVPGNLLAISKRATDLMVAPLFTLFFFALFVRFATAAGANAGALCGFLSAALIAFWDPLIEDRALSFTWINPVALVVGITVGCAVSRLTRPATIANTHL